jgi:hypothetical protein
MRPHDYVLKLFARIPPAAVTRYLTEQGFEKEGESNCASSALYRNPLDGRSVQVPLQPKDDFYAESMKGLLNYLRPNTQSIEELLVHVLIGPCRLHTFSLKDEIADWGLVRGTVISDVAPGLIDLWKFSAAGVLTAREEYKNIPSGADAFARATCFGQTEYGSYTLKLYTPHMALPDIDFVYANAQLINANDGFSSMVIEAVYNNLKYLSTSSGATLADKPSTLNRNVVSAALRMFPETVPLAELASEGEQYGQGKPYAPRKVVLDDRSHRQIRRVHEYFESVQDFVSINTHGYVVELHRDRPGVPDVEQVRRVTCDISHGKTWRKLLINLDETSYSTAVKWHNAQVVIRIEGLADKRSIPWTLSEVKRLEPILDRDKPTVPSLFTNH